MIFASSKDLFLKNINGIAKDIQAICYDDLSKETIIKDFGLWFIINILNYQPENFCSLTF